LVSIFESPDATDGCGIYFKIGQDTIAKIFLKDFETSKLPNDVNAFGELVKTTLVELKNK